MSGKVDSEWIIERLELLTRHADEIANAGGERENDFREMTVLKLSALAAVVDVYSKIAIEKFDRCYYIDALAGSGVTALRESKEYVIGSPILTPVVANQDFFSYHFIEEGSDKAAALEDRLRYLAGQKQIDYPYPKTRTHQANCNHKVPELLEQIKENNPRRKYKGINLLTLFDNSAMDATWDTVSEVANVFGDILITFPPTRISRDTGRINKLGEEWREEEITAFFGTEEWKDCSNEDEYLNLYTGRLEAAPNNFSRKTRTIRIESGPKGNRFYYTLIYSTRDTQSGAPYIEAIDYVKERIERLDGGAIESNIDVFRGDQSGLREFT